MTRQWQPLEIELRAQPPRSRDPLGEACPTVAFDGPSGERLEIRGFYDGRDTWRVRFLPIAAGDWRYRVTDTGRLAADGLREGRFRVEPAEGANPLFRHGGILKVGANGRHLTYTDGTPFFWLGDRGREVGPPP